MDRGQKDTEARLKDIERRINQEYAKAVADIEDELTDYFRRFKKKDETWRKWVEEGTKTQKEYEAWRTGQMAVGKRWETQKTIIAEELAHTNEIAKAMVKNETPQIFADNFNYATYQVEKDAKIDTAFTLYNREAVTRLVKDDPDVLPSIGKKVSQQIAEGKAVKWNKQQLQSVMIQGILQGDSIPKLATRLANTVGDRDRKAAIRNARTMATAAQNSGRVNAYKRAQDKGVDLEQMWMAVMDNRTRHTHRWLDGEVRPVGEAFSNGCEYPADPKGDPAEIYNCRCTLRGVVKGLERRAYKYRDTSAIEENSYDEWRNAKAKSNPITLQEEKGKAIRQSYINEYRGVKKSPISNYDYMGQPKNFEVMNTSIKAYEVEGMSNIYTQRYTNDAQKTIKLVADSKVDIPELNNVSSIVISKKMTNIAGYDHANNILYLNEKLGNDDYIKETLTDYFVADTAKDVLKHEMLHKDHWDAIHRLSITMGEDETTIKQRIEEELRKYVLNQETMEYNYIAKNVSLNASNSYYEHGLLNELIADEGLRAYKGIVKDKQLQRLIEEMFK